VIYLPSNLHKAKTAKKARKKMKYFAVFSAVTLSAMQAAFILVYKRKQEEQQRKTSDIIEPHDWWAYEWDDVMVSVTSSAVILSLCAAGQDHIANVLLAPMLAVAALSGGYYVIKQVV